MVLFKEKSVFEKTKLNFNQIHCSPKHFSLSGAKAKYMQS